MRSDLYVAPCSSAPFRPLTMSRLAGVALMALAELCAGNQALRVLVSSSLS
jgi:hypothetical protein